MVLHIACLSGRLAYPDATNREAGAATCGHFRGGVFGGDFFVADVRFRAVAFFIEVVSLLPCYWSIRNLEMKTAVYSRDRRLGDTAVTSASGAHPLGSKDISHVLGWCVRSGSRTNQIRCSARPGYCRP